MRSSMVSVTGGSLASIFSRDWAWVALEALARKRSTKACMWARLASILPRMASARRDFSARCSSKLS